MTASSSIAVAAAGSPAGVAAPSRHGWRSYALTVALISALVASVAAFSAWKEKQRHHERGSVATQNIARLLDQNLSDDFDKVDLVLQSAADYYRDHAGRGRLDAAKLDAQLAALQSRLPQIADLRIADKDGVVRFGSGILPAATADLSHRDYFVRARDEGASGLLIAGPLPAYNDQRWVIAFVRRLDAADGSFAGVVFASIGTAHFERLLSSVQLGPRGAVSIRTDDLALVHRYPKGDDAIGSTLVSRQLREVIATGAAHGEYVAATALDGIERSNAYRKLPRYPFYVIVGRATDDYLSEWLEHARTLFGLALLTIVVTCVAIARAYRITRRLESEVVERRRVETELLAAKAQAERANADKSRFLAAASHDLRQPLAALSLYVGTMDRRLGTQHAELVGSIRDCVDNLSELLNDLLDVSKLGAGVVVPRLSVFPIDEVLAELVSVHSAEAQAKGLRLHFRRCGAIVRTDPTLLRRLLGNLLANAIAFSDSGGVLIACRHHQGELWVEVWDTGVGIAEEQFAVIFDEFKQLGDGARTRGSGLGLAIVDKTANLLGLKLRLRSRPGHGSMFAVELPPGPTPESGEAVSVRAFARRLRIALVDDHANFRNALALALAEAGHEVLAAASGAELIARLEHDAPDVVIADYHLAAGENGVDVIKAVRELFATDLPAFLLTGDTDPLLRRGMADQGIELHCKPLAFDALQAIIAAATDRRSP